MQRTIRIFTIVSLAFLSGALLANQPSSSVNGDVDGDGKLNISDAIYILNHLFGVGPPPVPGVATEKPTVIYLVRHTEANKDDPTSNVPVGHLTEEGQVRAGLLSERFRDAKIDIVVSSHLTRAFQTVFPLAEAHGLEIRQMPAPGSTQDDTEVTEATHATASIEPMIEALCAVPPGSVVVAAGHSSTLYAIMEGLGVRVATEDEPCEEGDTSCLPCNKKECFPGKQFDNLWVVTPAATPGVEAAMVRLRYGDPCEVPEPVE